MFAFLLLFFQHLDGHSDLDSEEIENCTIDPSLQSSEIVSLMIVVILSAVILKLAIFGDYYFLHRALRC